jgi:DNA-binding MarR family transcriptional regulator
MNRTGEPDNGEPVSRNDLDDVGRHVEEASLALVEMTLNAIVEEGDLSVTQLRVLLAVDRHGPLNLSTLAAHLGTSISSAGRLVARLDTAGLLTRLLSLHSRREITIEVAPLGRQTLQRLRATRRRQIDSILIRLPPDTRRTLARVLLEFTAATRHDEEPTCVH